MRLLKLLAAAFAVFVSSAVWGQSTGNQDLTVGTTTKLSLRAHGMAVSIVVKTKVVKAREFLGARFVEGQFTDTFSIVEDLEINVNNKSLPVPLSAFVDLMDVRKCELILSPSQDILRIHGGDASESFEGKSYFDKTAVRRRAVFDPASPKKPMEETIYDLRVID